MHCISPNWPTSIPSKKFKRDCRIYHPSRDENGPRRSSYHYELIFCTVESTPREPAHFLALKKETKKDSPSSSSSSSTSAVSSSFSAGGNERGGGFPWPPFSFSSSKSTLSSSSRSKQPPPLEVLLVVRGTKELSDILSDVAFEETDYRNGKAHEGICESGRYLVEKHMPLLQHLLDAVNGNGEDDEDDDELQKKKKKNGIRMTLMGHSLGASAAAIACMEFNDRPNIDTTCLAFECPALVNKDLSERWKDRITTIVADADCIPHLSGATLYNLLVNLLQHDFRSRAIEDVSIVLRVLMQKMPALLMSNCVREITNFVRGRLDKNVRLALSWFDPLPAVLFPPGRCVHFYRDGIRHFGHGHTVQFLFQYRCRGDDGQQSHD